MRFSMDVALRANDLYFLAVSPLFDAKGSVLKHVGYPGEQAKTLWHIHCTYDCNTPDLAEKLQAVGIADEAAAIAYMDEIEPKLRRWAESMAELNDSVVKALELRTQTTLLGDVLTEEQRGELLG